jgi:hypothetical protein
MSRPAFASLLATVSAVLAFAGCQRPDPSGPSPTLAAGATASKAPAPAGICEAQRALARLDTRIAVPLVPMMADHQRRDMRDHLLAVQEIVLAAASDDFSGVERAAGRIGFSEQMGQTCAHMGAGAAGFTELALTFHHAADTITAAARQRDGAAVLRALGTTLQTCTGCHAAYRQDVVDEATWNRVTSMLAPGERPPGP